MEDFDAFIIMLCYYLLEQMYDVCNLRVEVVSCVEEKDPSSSKERESVVSAIPTERSLPSSQSMATLEPWHRYFFRNDIDCGNISDRNICWPFFPVGNCRCNVLSVDSADVGDGEDPVVMSK